ncbi:putative redox protein [Salinibacter ruber]|uniref:bifunctional alpha/beta hydrolase/OsmC family protein n=1 Tax=Salinibacter ruber TaxID=146919 RepID=UPI002073270E|nr:bifunctional alpha/beta hydrolase/OsmC family protein [Salinibacter ruber]MCS3629686.1 putative redox protein [Salinibacter ruber]MCS3830426.1 putative redox protein [Salinibacter ruber]MCS4056503.1 putative redox protein [Salinibacter ruber]MCS4060727.1 putative redox protein [Salinibacter ruber]MCS4102661.1 putative redox protein [Salinibacter ruber]
MPEKVRFENADGNALAARLDRPDGESPCAFALFAHCFTCSKDLRAAGAISRALTRHGIAVLRFDFTGLGESEGEFADTNFSSNVEDLIAAAGYLSEHYEAPRILVGHSLGGAAVLQAAQRLDSVQAVSTIGAPYDPGHVTQHLQDAVEDIEEKGEARVQLAGRTFTIRKQFLDDLAATKMETTIRTLGRALLIFHSPVDQTVGANNAAKIFQAAKHPKSFVSLDDADHLLTDRSDAEYLGVVLGAWAEKYVDRSVSEPETPDEDVVTRTEGTYRTAIQAGQHALVGDEPESVGGDDDGPTPYGFLLSALGSCTGMTLRMYADRKEWPLDETIVRLSHEKVHAEDCENCDTEQGQVDRITREIEIRGRLSDDQRERLFEIANKCPVHRTLLGDVDVRSSLRSRDDAQ